MKLLLDTQILLWAAGQPERLSVAARRLLELAVFDSAPPLSKVA